MYFFDREKAKRTADQITDIVKNDNGKLFKSKVIVSVHSEYTVDQVPDELMKHIIKGAYTEYISGRSEN